MFTIVVIIASVLVALLVIGALWKRVRPSANFNLIYTRALRVEGSKEVAIAAALEHLRTFLAPFDQLSDNQIAPLLRCFLMLMSRTKHYNRFSSKPSAQNL
jgi:hypothetical protein